MVCFYLNYVLGGWRVEGSDEGKGRDEEKGSKGIHLGVWTRVLFLFLILFLLLWGNLFSWM